MCVCVCVCVIYITNIIICLVCTYGCVLLIQMAAVQSFVIHLVQNLFIYLFNVTPVCKTNVSLLRVGSADK